MKKFRKFLPAAILAAPLIIANSGLTQTDAAENRSITNLKQYIFGSVFARYDSALDTNSDRCLDVFDVIRFKQKQYGIGECGLNDSITVTTTATTALTTQAVSETTSPSASAVVTSPASEVTTEGVSSVTDVQTTVSQTVLTDNSVSVLTDITTEPSETATESSQVTALTTTVTETNQITDAVTTEASTPAPVTTTTAAVTAPAVTTTVTTTTSAPVTTTVTTTTSAPVTTTVTTTTTPPVTTAVTTTTPAPVKEIPSKKIISSVKSLLQSPELPTGCEATGLTIAIRWYGYDVSKTDVAMKYMPRQDFYYSGGRLIGADFNTTFAGDPSRNDMSYGCYIPCMIKTVDNYFQAVGSSYRGKDISGKELEDLFPYIANNTPVILISTPELMTPRTGDSWYTSDGRYVTWQRGHHCMVLIGYDKTRSKVYCADPMMLKGVVEWDIAQFKNIYNQKGKHAMIIDTGSVTPPRKALKEGELVRFAGWLNSSSQGGGSETYLDSGVYTITKILTDTSVPYPVSIGNAGWTSIDAIYENQPYYGNGTPSSDPSPQPSTPSTPATPSTPSTPAPSGVQVSNGQVYNIVNVKSGKYLNVDYGKDNDGTNIYQWSNDGSTEQKFKMASASDAWKIYAMCSSSGNGRLVTAAKAADGENVYLFKATSDITQQWVLTRISDNVFAIGLKAYPGYVLTIPDSENGSASGTGKTSAGNVFISKYTGADEQLWYFRQ